MALTSSVSGQRVPPPGTVGYGPLSASNAIRRWAIGASSTLTPWMVRLKPPSTRRKRWVAQALRGAAVPAASLRRLGAGSSLSLCVCMSVPASHVPVSIDP